MGFTPCLREKYVPLSTPHGRVVSPVSSINGAPLSPFSILLSHHHRHQHHHHHHRPTSSGAWRRNGIMPSLPPLPYPYPSRPLSISLGHAAIVVCIISEPLTPLPPKSFPWNNYFWFGSSKKASQPRRLLAHPVVISGPIMAHLFRRPRN